MSWYPKEVTSHEHRYKGRIIRSIKWGVGAGIGYALGVGFIDGTSEIFDGFGVATVQFGVITAVLVTVVNFGVTALRSRSRTKD